MVVGVGSFFLLIFFCSFPNFLFVFFSFRCLIAFCPRSEVVEELVVLLLDGRRALPIGLRIGSIIESRIKTRPSVRDQNVTRRTRSFQVQVVEGRHNENTFLFLFSFLFPGARKKKERPKLIHSGLVSFLFRLLLLEFFVAVVVVEEFTTLEILARS